MEIPVYLVNGFLESGKTTFIKNTLSDPDFTENKPSLVIACVNVLSAGTIPYVPALFYC